MSQLVIVDFRIYKSYGLLQYINTRWMFESKNTMVFSNVYSRCNLKNKFKIAEIAVIIKIVNIIPVKFESKVMAKNIKKIKGESKYSMVGR